MTRCAPSRIGPARCAAVAAVLARVTAAVMLVCAAAAATLVCVAATMTPVRAAAAVTLIRAAAAATVVCAAVAATPVRAEGQGGLPVLPPGPAIEDGCLDWDSPSAMAEQGTLRGLAPGPLHWRIGYRALHGVHRHTGVQIRWRGRDGRDRAQTLFSEIQDGRPRLTREGNRLVLRVSYCPQGEGACRIAALPFAWDEAAQRFRGTTQAARDVLVGTECDPS